MSGSERIQPTQNIESQAAQKRQQVLLEKLSQEEAEQVPTENDLEELVDEAIAIPIRREFKPIEEHKHSKKVEGEETFKKDDEEESVGKIVKAEEVAERYQKQNVELDRRALILLLQKISITDTKEEILEKVLQFYPDKSLADEALDFLIDSTQGSLKTTIQEAKILFRSRYQREIVAGKNIQEEAIAFSKQGLGATSLLKDLYRDITANPRSAENLLDEFIKNYSFAQLKPMIKFLLHALGADLKAKGPSIPRAELKQLLDELRTMQALLGVYNFFFSRTKMIKGQFQQYNLDVPPEIQFEALAKQFFALLQERYITPTRVKQIAINLKIKDNLIAQIITLIQMRDAVRGIAPRLYKTKQQKDDLLEAILETLDDLEKEMEGEEDG